MEIQSNNWMSHTTTITKIDNIQHKILIQTLAATTAPMTIYKYQEWKITDNKTVKITKNIKNA